MREQTISVLETRYYKQNKNLRLNKGEIQENYIINEPLTYSKHNYFQQNMKCGLLTHILSKTHEHFK